jgi:hypothetical protein
MSTSVLMPYVPASTGGLYARSLSAVRKRSNGKST